MQHVCIQVPCIRKWGRQCVFVGVDPVHPGVDALHAACITILKYAVNVRTCLILGVLLYLPNVVA